jgi:hypothetical protein
MDKQKMTIDGVEYELSYDFNRICDCEKQAGCNLLDAIANFLKPSAEQLRGLIFAAIERNAKGLTIEQVGALMRIDTIGPLRDALLNAYSAALPTEPDAPGAAPAEPPQG